MEWRTQGLSYKAAFDTTYPLEVNIHATHYIPMKLLSAHQPVYLPWLGFFHKVSVSDLFVIFDDVPYSKKMWYNRNKILGPNGAFLLSVPVFASLEEGTKHKDVQIDNTKNWATKHWRSIHVAYRKHPFFSNYSSDLEEIYSRPWVSLAELNITLMKKIMVWLGINTPIVRASDYSFQGEKSALVLDMCIRLEASAYLFGALGRDYAKKDEFKSANVAPLFQDYKHPTYVQYKKIKFEPNMCVLDLLFCHGDASVEIMHAANPSRNDYLDEAKRFLNG